MTIYCITCNIQTVNPKFCSRSCSAKFNNKGKRRHGFPPSTCKICGKITSSAKRIYCSNVCSNGSRKTSIETKKYLNAERQSKYRCKKYRVLDNSANPDTIKQIYKNCPEGHEVDHIFPLSKGGLHHEDNLQYLTKEDNRKKSNKIW